MFRFFDNNITNNILENFWYFLVTWAYPVLIKRMRYLLIKTVRNTVESKLSHF